MNIRCSKDELLKALQIVSRALPVTTAIPELTHILFNASDKQLHLSATNMRTYISTSIPCEVVAGGEVLIQGGFFLELVSNLKEYNDSRVEIEINPQNYRIHFTVDGEPIKYELPGRGTEEYPNVELIEPDAEFEIAGNQLKDLLRFGGLCSAATDNSIQGFRGVCFDFEGDQLNLASMDGNRLVKVTVPSPLKVEGTERWLMGMDVISELQKILPDTPILIRKHNTRIQIRFENTIFQSLLSDSDFVDYESFIPEDLENGITLSASGFANHLRGLAPVSRESGNRVVLEIDDVKMGMSSYSEKYGEGYREIPLQNHPDFDEKLTVAFNSKYLLDYIGILGDDTVNMVCEGEGMPAYFWPASTTDDFRHVCVIMSLSMQ